MSVRARQRWVAVASALLVGALAACGGGDGAEPGATDATADVAPTSEQVTARLEISATGGAAVDFAAEVKLTVTSFSPVDREYSLLSVGLTDFVEASGGRRFRTAVDLAGVYDGPGTYEFGTGQSGAAGLSNTFLHLVELRDPDGPFDESNVVRAIRFEQPKVTCTMVVDSRHKGRLDCPRLSAPDGTEIAYRMSWSA